MHGLHALARVPDLPHFQNIVNMLIRNGKLQIESPVRIIVTEDVKNMTHDSLIQAMVGRTLDNLFPKEFGRKGECFLKVEHLNEAGVLHDVSFEAYGGQILGVAGLVGAGRTETMRAIFGADPLDSGTISIKGKPVHIRRPQDAIRHGIAFLTIVRGRVWCCRSR